MRREGDRVLRAGATSGGHLPMSGPRVAVAAMLTAAAMWLGAPALRGWASAAGTRGGRVPVQAGPGASLRSVECGLREMPRSALARRNVLLALRRLDGLVVAPGGRVHVLRVLGPWTDDRYCFAPCEDPGPYLACFGAGAERAVRMLTCCARAAGLQVDHGRQAETPSPSPVPWDLQVHNPTRDGARVTASWRGGRPRLRITPTPLAPDASRTHSDDLSAPLTVAFVGDVQADPRAAPLTSDDLKQLAGDGLGALLRGADLVVANLECPLTDRGEPTPYKTARELREKKEFVFRATPAAGLQLARCLGLDITCLANNHIQDYGPQGVADTRGWLREAGILTAGPTGEGAKAEACLVTRRGMRLRVGAFAVADTLAPRARIRATGGWVVRVGPREATAQVAEAVRGWTRAGAVPVVAVHWGQERSTEPTALQRELARACADAGAAIVVGHHPHRLQPVDSVGGCVTAFSLGDFVFAPASAEQALSGVLMVELWGGRAAAAGLIPVQLTPRGRPQLLCRSEQEPVRKVLAALGLDPR